MYANENPASQAIAMKGNYVTSDGKYKQNNLLF